MPNSLKVFLDDVREPPEGWVLVRTAAEAIAVLETGNVTDLSLDHDLGDPVNGTGHDVACWIEEAVALRGFVPPTLSVHSANPVGRQRMLDAIANIHRIQRGTRP